MVESPYVAAWQAAQACNYVQYEDIMPSAAKTPEALLIEKDSFDKGLSEQAKMVIQVIFKEPEGLVPPIRNTGISWTRVNAYLLEHFDMKRKETEKIRKEIVRWLGNLK